MAEQPVPILRQTQPLQAPQQADTADLFFKALAARQQQGQQQLEAQKMLADTVMGVSSLMQKKRQADMENEQGKAMLDLRNRIADQQQSLQNYLLNATPTATEIGGKPAVVTPGKNGPQVKFAPQAGGGQLKQKDPNAKITVDEALKMNLPIGSTYQQMWDTQKTPVSEKGAESISAANNAFVQFDNFERMMSDAGLPDSDIEAATVGRARYLKGMAMKSSPEGEYMAQMGNISNLVRQLGEKGVLTNQDLERIQTAIPGFTDTRASALKKLNIMRDMAEENQFNVSRGLSRENVAGSRDTLKNFLSRKAKVGVSKEYALVRAKEMLSRGQLTKE